MLNMLDQRYKYIYIFALDQKRLKWLERQTCGLSWSTALLQL